MRLPNLAATLGHLKWSSAPLVLFQRSLTQSLALNRPIAGLVHNAGMTRDGLFVSMKEKAWTEVTQAHLNGFYALTRPLLRGMLKARHGRIVTIVSFVGEKGNAGQVNYAAAKAGLIGATKALALEVGSRGLTVNAVSPGFIETDMTADLDREKIVERIPFGRPGSAEEVGICGTLSHR